MEDMHIHLKETIYNQKLFDIYVERCIACGIKKAVFLDHGNRISNKHKPVLSTKGAMDQLDKKVSEFRKSDLASKIEILKGIEIDYSDDLNFRNETFDILNYGNFDWIVGAIHSMNFDNYGNYLRTIIDMLNNYDINVIAHIKKTNQYNMYDDLFGEILDICSKKNVLIEINTSDRSRWDDGQLYYMLEIMKKYNVNYVFSSDAHKFEEIGYMIKETEEKVKKWQKTR